ncbi:MAG: hypothetical protein D4R48_03180 [Nitrosomonadales bacterium]|nr:MAG: hypothetical protein D4R48_03180 [Nitrosomonadales bacterium]
MNAPKFPAFKLISYHSDYIEFSVSYFLGFDCWVAVGIGWIVNGSPVFYINDLRLSIWPVEKHRYEEAFIGLDGLSLKFKHDSLEDFALKNIKRCFVLRKRV